MTAKVQKERSPSSSIIGLGLVTLDVVINGDLSQPLMTTAGGTCGNVLVNLAYLGWESYPLARTRNDWAGVRVDADLTRWNVKTDFLHLAPTTPTPIIIHRIKCSPEGVVSHSFSWSCPKCHRRLPTYQAVTTAGVRRVPLHELHPAVFFFDRPSAGAIHLAEEARRQGSLVVFEFAGRGPSHILQKAFRVAHILKYAQDRVPEIPGEERTPPYLEIMTLGEQGLSYRCNLPRCKQSSWKHISAFPINKIKDAAGAGDWCTAGLIHQLGSKGVDGLDAIKRDHLIQALRYAQALAAVNCLFEGARGSMYVLSPRELDNAVETLLRGKRNVQLPDAISSGMHPSRSDECPLCGII